MSTKNTNGYCHNTPLHYIEQIALNKGGIACLDGRVARAETDIRERYTKEEVDRMLACKADRCALEKHLIDPCAHWNGCLQEDCGKPKGCEYDCYSKEEIDDLLAEKASIPKEIPAGSDLDDYQTPGFYYSHDNDATVDMLNLPEGNRHSFSLLVQQGWGEANSLANQLLITHAFFGVHDSRMYFRTMGHSIELGEIWQPWKRLMTTD